MLVFQKKCRNFPAYVRYGWPLKSTFTWDLKCTPTVKISIWCKVTSLSAFAWVQAKWNSLTVCSYHVTYAFQSGSTLYSCLNVKELLAPNRHEIWKLSDCNWTRTQKHLVCDMTRTCSQMHGTDKYSEHSSIIWPVWLNGWVFGYELSGSGFESKCRSENHFGTSFSLVKFTEVRFQTAVSFPCKQ